MLNKIIDFYWGRGLHLAVPMLAFYLLVSLAPLILGLAAIGGIVFEQFLTPAKVAGALSERFPEEIRTAIINLAGSVRNNPSAVIISTVAMSWTFSSALMVIEHIMSPPLGDPVKMILGRARLVLFGFLFAVLLLVSIAANTILADIAPVGGTVEVVYGFLIIFAGSALLYKILPRKRPRWVRAFLGAIPASLGLFFTPYLLTLYLSFREISWGGIFAGVIILLASCYIISLAFLIGAGIAAEKESGLKSGGYNQER